MEESKEVEKQVKALRNEVARRNGCSWSGLRNMGNSCYLNAVVQCLAVIGRKMSYRGGNPVLAELSALVNRLWEQKGGVITPSRLKRAVGKADSLFNNSQPQDAHEVLACLLSSVENTYLGQRISGKSCSTVQCGNCSYVSQTEQPFKWISVPFGTDGMSEVVPDMLDRYHTEEMISADDGWRCGGCGMMSAAVKRLEIRDLPDVLILHLKRFDYADGQMHKVENEVGVPTDMQVSDEGYTLVAMVMHSGSQLTGHYVAKIYTDDGWFLVDDHRVKKTTVKVFSWCPSAYILMYCKSQKLFLGPDASNRRGPATSMSQGKGAETRCGSF